MRVLCIDGAFVIAVKYAECVGKQLVFTASDGSKYHTDDYNDKIAVYGKLNALAVHGYIAVERLYISNIK